MSKAVIDDKSLFPELVSCFLKRGDVMLAAFGAILARSKRGQASMCEGSKGVRYGPRNGRAPTEGWSGAPHNGT